MLHGEGGAVPNLEVLVPRRSPSHSMGRKGAVPNVENLVSTLNLRRVSY